MQHSNRPLHLSASWVALAVAIATASHGGLAATALAQASAPAGDAARDRAEPPPPPEHGRPPRGPGGRRGLPPDWPRAGGYGPAGDRRAIEGMVLDGLSGVREPGQELSDADLAAVIEVAREISPEWGNALEERAARNERQLRMALGAGGRRLLALVALRERAPTVYGAKIAEFRAQARTERAAEALARAERLAVEDGAGGDAVAAARAELEAAAAAQVGATFAARRAELEALEARLAQFRADLAEDERAADAEAAALAEDAKSRVRRGGEARNDPRE